LNTPTDGASMSDLHDDLRSAFEAADLAVDSVQQNRSRIQIALLVDDADAEQLRSIVRETVGEDRALGLDVSTDSPEGQDGVSTVVSFRYRE
jgi:aspartokinase